MASVRINQFHNLDLMNRVAVSQISAITRLAIQNVYLPGSISFNNIQVIVSQSHTSGSLSLSFGLYSLNGATLSLANSASGVQGGANNLSWITLATSATQDITPGDWYFAMMSSTSGQNAFSLVVNPNLPGNVGIEEIHQGPLFRGKLNTNAMPASIATSDVTKEGSSFAAADLRYPYILISA